MSFIYFAIQTYAQNLLRHDKHGNCRDVVDLVLYVASSAESIDLADTDRRVIRSIVQHLQSRAEALSGWSGMITFYIELDNQKCKLKVMKCIS